MKKTTLFNQRTFARASALCLLALAATLFHAREARAQWTAPNAQGNINTTNTGNVGVGTTTPPYNVTVVKDQVGSTTLGVFNGADGPATIAAMGVGRLLDWSDKYFTFGVTPPGFGVPGLNDTGIMHTKGVTLKFGSESAHDIHFFTNGYNNTRMTITGGGNVGIGVAAPSQALHVMGKGLVQNTGTASAFIMDRTDGKIASFGAGGNSATLAYDDTGAFKIESNTRANINSGSFGSAMGATTRFMIGANGNVGVGTDSPTEKLHVAGNIVVDGNINAKYQDVAEWVPSTQKLSTGTVVILDAGRNNHVLASHRAYDTRVAGVISAQPGLSLGEAGEGKVLVATTGRVKVKVDASRGAINIGDLIVTSDVPGVGMLSQPVSVAGVEMHRPGTIIGKALESLGKGTGEILVLLSLQ